MDIDNRVVVITGGGSGIGEALARACAEAGASHMVVADLHGDQAVRVADEIGGAAAEIDVRSEDAIRHLVERTESEFGPIGAFVSNAGYVTVGGVEDTNERIQAMWEVHVLAHVYAARAVLPQMIANGGGYLLNTASAAGLLTQIGSMAYSVTKGAAVSLAEWLAVTHYHQGVRVSVLCPQAVHTNIIMNSPDSDGAITGDDDDIGSGVAGGDGVLSAEQVAQSCLDAMHDERFWVLPHAEVGEYARRKADDIDRWLAGMRRLQGSLYDDGALPGDAIAPTI